MTQVKRHTILIVDDMPANRILLKAIFGDLYGVEEAADGREALAKLKHLPEVSVVILNIAMPEMDGFGVLEAMKYDVDLCQIPTIAVTADSDEETQIKALSYGAVDVLTKPYNTQIFLQRVKNILARREAFRLAEQNRAYARDLRLSETDDKSGLYNKHGFIRHAAKVLKENPQKKYVVVRWDLDNFKIYNDWFGVVAGDELLKKIGAYYLKNAERIPGLVTVCRWDAEHFVSLREADSFDPEDMLERMWIGLHRINQGFEYLPRIGIYAVDDPDIDVMLMCDRALIALRSIKSKYNTAYARYDQSMRDALAEEQQILNEMVLALRKGQFIFYLQPQYNYDDHSLLGAEALVRWNHPEKGILLPSRFVPLFERNGFISKLDEYIWDHVCAMLRDWLDNDLPVVPISLNVSRRDIYNPQLCRIFENLLKTYDLDPGLLHLEITETAYAQNTEQLIEMVNALRSLGLKVDMDDFGSGYSSLNTLCNMPVDLLKLDMKFLNYDNDSEKRDNILNAVVRMSHSLRLPVLAEGVETKEQADYLKSIGCLFMQGYYFAKPMPVKEFRQLLGDVPYFDPDNSVKENVEGALNFLSASVQSTLLFNSFVGGAAIVEYDDEAKTLNALRINDRFFRELRCSRTDYAKHASNILDGYSEEYKNIFIDMLKTAIAGGEEASAEVRSKAIAEGEKDIWLRLRTRFLAKNVNRCILYLSIENITAHMNLLINNTELSERLSSVIKSIPGGVINFEVVGDNIRILFMNRGLSAMFGYDYREYKMLFGDDITRVIHPDDKAAVIAKVKQAITGDNRTLMGRYRHICKGGGWKWVEMSGRVMRRGDNFTLTSGIVLDVSDRLRQEEREQWQNERYRILCMSNGSMTFDYAPEDDRLVFTATLPEKGYREEIFENYLRDFTRKSCLAPEYHDVYLNRVKQAVHEQIESTFEYKADYFGKGLRWYRDYYVSIPNRDGKIIRIVGRVEDVDDEITEKEHLRRKVERDGITGLINKESAHLMIEQFLEEREKDQLDVMMFIDIDDFKLINDNCGHIEGDRVLKEIGEILRNSFRGIDVVSRFGGDEFVVYMRSVAGIPNAIEKANAVSKAISAIEMTDGSTIYCSIGIAPAWTENDGFEKLLVQADKAMYGSKKNGKNSCRLYCEDGKIVSVENIS